jgi:hypothetical protein
MDIEFQDEFGWREQRNRRLKYMAIAGVSVVIAIIVGGVVLTAQKSAPDPASSGFPPSRTFAFELGSLEGDSSQTGTIYIKTRPEWAPLGVGRFHVSLSPLSNCFRVPAFLVRGVSPCYVFSATGPCRV